MEHSVASHTEHCLLPLIQPVRHCLHGFLSAATVTRLMQASRSLTVSLLAGYSFVDHVFTYDNQTAADVKRSIALYTRYRMRIVRMSLPRRWKGEPLVDSESGQSWLPASVEALALGPEMGDRQRGSLVYSAYARNTQSQQGTWWHEEDSLCAWMVCCRLESGGSADEHRSAFEYDICRGAFNQLIPPGVLPRGLRFLQFNGHFNQPLQVGSIPDTVEALQFCRNFNQPLEAGHLPASLTHLVFGRDFNQPLLPGVLPTGLRSLHLGWRFEALLQPGMLPPQLQHLTFGYYYNHPLGPGVVPPSVTHLKLSMYFNQPLEVGCIPRGVEYLDLGWFFNKPLLPAVLPTSLRVLNIGRHFNRPLVPGSLPDGLEVLAFHSVASFQHELQPGVIPATVVAVILGKQYEAELVPGGIPETVRWLRLPWYYHGDDLSGVLAPSTTVSFWSDAE